ncbi:MAG TPA: N-acetyltransferase, partial [Candidatus Limnocylindria bacterium]|nr:N-acetyltransferase [Candidatus Limnocylindria bacterium]
MRVGPGTLIEDDVQLGGEPGSRRSGGGLEIGRRGVVRRGSAVHDGVRIGDRLQTGINVVIGEDTRMGDDCRIGNNTIIDPGCTIGDRVEI